MLKICSLTQVFCLFLSQVYLLRITILYLTHLAWFSCNFVRFSLSLSHCLSLSLSLSVSLCLCHMIVYWRANVFVMTLWNFSPWPRSAQNKQIMMGWCFLSRVICFCKCIFDQVQMLFIIILKCPLVTIIKRHFLCMWKDLWEFVETGLSVDLSIIVSVWMHCNV